jgi:hypothetical protein
MVLIDKYMRSRVVLRSIGSLFGLFFMVFILAKLLIGLEWVGLVEVKYGVFSRMGHARARLY